MPVTLQTRRRPRARFTALALALLTVPIVEIVACSSQSAAPANANDTSAAALPAPPNPKNTGCALIQNVADDAGCRVDVSCTDGGLLTFVCAFADGAARCACANGETTESQPQADIDVCTNDGGPASAAALCGWGSQP
jgi:hypothetical protein